MGLEQCRSLPQDSSKFFALVGSFFRASIFKFFRVFRVFRG
jgi:hypothetical protein